MITSHILVNYKQCAQIRSWCWNNGKANTEIKTRAIRISSWVWCLGTQSSKFWECRNYESESPDLFLLQIDVFVFFDIILSLSLLLHVIQRLLGYLTTFFKQQL